MSRFFQKKHKKVRRRISLPSPPILGFNNKKLCFFSTAEVWLTIAKNQIHALLTSREEINVRHAGLKNVYPSTWNVTVRKRWKCENFFFLTVIYRWEKFFQPYNTKDHREHLFLFIARDSRQPEDVVIIIIIIIHIHIPEVF